MSKKKKVGLCASGAGANIFYFVEAYDTLIKNGIYIDAFSGVSSGAAFAYCAAANRMGLLKHIVNSVKNRNIMREDSSIMMAINFLTGNKSLVDSSPLKELIQTIVTDRPTKQCIVGVSDMMHNNYYKNDLKECSSITYIQEQILASMTIPVLFEKVSTRYIEKYDGITSSNILTDHAVDGGVINFSPVSDLLDEGVDELWVLLSKPDMLPKYNKHGIVNDAKRVFEMIMNEAMKNDLKVLEMNNQYLDLMGMDEVTLPNGKKRKRIDYHVIKPDLELRPMTDFNSRKYEGQGRSDTMRYLERVRRG